MRRCVCFFVLLLLGSNFVFASMFQDGQSYLTGKITDIQYVEEKFYPAQPGMSGTLHYDRTVGAHYLIFLDDTQNEQRQPVELKHYPKGSITLFADQKDAKKNKTLSSLKAGMIIKITNYTLRGDEGSIFEAYAEELEIIK